MPATKLWDNNSSLGQNLLRGSLRVLSALRRLPRTAYSWCSRRPVFSTFALTIASMVVIFLSITLLLGGQSQTPQVIEEVASQSGVSYSLELVHWQVCHITDSAHRGLLAPVSAYLQSGSS
jgi:hypothetical protein